MGPAPGSHWVDARQGPLPLWLSHQTDPYWCEHLKEESTLYIQDNFVLDRDDPAIGANGKGGESFKEFFDRVISYAESNNVPRVVIDLRLNGGGNNLLLLPVIHRLIRSDWVNRKGHLYVLIGRRTQSAAQNFTNLLEIHTAAVFVGEPTGESPNHYGDPESVRLPSSGIEIALSSLWWQDMGPRDTRVATEPAVKIELSASDYESGKDPVLEYVLGQPLDR
jgi:hypothetical protein